MPRTEITYPEWVQKYRERGTTVKIKETLIIYTNEHPKEYQGKNIPSQ